MWGSKIPPHKQEMKEQNIVNYVSEKLQEIEKQILDIDNEVNILTTEQLTKYGQLQDIRIIFLRILEIIKSKN